MKKFWWPIAGLLFVHLFLLFSFQFTAWPEMFSFPYLLNNRFRLYVDFVHPYPPLLTQVLAGLYRIFGYQLWVLQTITWLLILVADLLIIKIIWLVSKSHMATLVGLSFYILTQPFLEGNMLWFDTAIVAPVLAGTYFMLKRRYFWSGLFLALAVLTKQTAGVFLVFGMSYVMYMGKDIKKVMSFLRAPLLAGLGLLGYLLVTNTVVDFVNWTLIYPSKYWTKFPGYVQMALSKREWLVIFLLGLPVLILLFKLKKKILNESSLLFIICNLILAIAIVYPRWSFFHFQTALAFLAILAGCALFVSRRLRIFLSVVSCAPYIVLVIIPVIKSSWHREARFWSTTELETAQVVKQKSDGSENLFLLGPNSIYYVLTGTLPPKPWLDNFGWYWEIPGVADRVLDRWQLNLPEHVLLEKTHTGNWFDLGTYRPTMVTNWLIENYNQKESVNENLTIWQKN